MLTKDKIIEDNKMMENMSEEEKEEAITKAYYKNLDSHLNEIFLNRALELGAFPDKKDEIDKYISERSKELIEKFSGMSMMQLMLHSIVGMLDAGVPDDVMGEILK